MDIRQQLLAAFEAEHREHLDAIRACLAAAAEQRPVDWNDVFRRAHSLKGASRAVDLPRVEAVAHRLETVFERIKGGERVLDKEALTAIHLALDRIEAFVSAFNDRGPEMPDDALASLDRVLQNSAETPASLEGSRPKLTAHQEPGPEPAPDAVRQSMVRIPSTSVAAVMSAAHGLANALSGQTAIADAVAGLAASLFGLRRRLDGVRMSRAERDPARMRAAIGDLDSALASILRDCLDLSRRQRSGSAAIDTATAHLREEVERLALVPAETAFGGFARALREMARENGQEVAVTVRGLDLPLDRSMLQALRDPVLHALRNALGHGGEPAQVRRRAGKPEALSILFEVEARGSRLIISVDDDGCGPDLGAIETRARDNGLLSPGEAVDQQQLLALVFEPGFSTAKGVDVLSGRGIGLAVVAEAVRKLQGEVRLSPRTPHGASLSINLPLSAARRPLLLVESAGIRFALPSASVERVMSLAPSDVGTVGGRPIVHVESSTAGHEALSSVPVADLSEILGLDAEAMPAADSLPAILVRAGDRRCVLRVDALEAVRTLLVLPAPPIGTDPALVVGTVVLGSDTPVLVLDPEGLIARSDAPVSRARRTDSAAYIGGRGPVPESRRSTILVVDDSITTRTLEKSILEAAGYRVVVCVDGQDALDHLRSEIELIDLVVADVEMPRLDGFGLLQALRADTAFANLPVILMTSRGESDDVARGLELGADAYLTKQKFDQRELLNTIGQLL